MEALNIKGTDDTPNIILDKDKGHFEIVGKSLPEAVTAFYKPVFDWLDKYMTKPAKKSILKLKFEYFNSASSKVIAELIKTFAQLKEMGYDIEVHWYYPDDDEEMLEAGEEFSEISKCKFEYISYVVD